MKIDVSRCPVCGAEMRLLFGSRMYRCQNLKAHFLSLSFAGELRMVKGEDEVLWVDVISRKEYPPKLRE